MEDFIEGLLRCTDFCCLVLACDVNLHAALDSYRWIQSEVVVFLTYRAWMRFDMRAIVSLVSILAGY